MIIMPSRRRPGYPHLSHVSTFKNRTWYDHPTILTPMGWWPSPNIQLLTMTHMAIWLSAFSCACDLFDFLTCFFVICRLVVICIMLFVGLVQLGLFHVNSCHSCHFMSCHVISCQAKRTTTWRSMTPQKKHHEKPATHCDKNNQTHTKTHTAMYLQRLCHVSIPSIAFSPGTKMLCLLDQP